MERRREVMESEKEEVQPRFELMRIGWTPMEWFTYIFSEPCVAHIEDGYEGDIFEKKAQERRVSGKYEARD
jgi:hypothetical protein